MKNTVILMVLASTSILNAGTLEQSFPELRGNPHGVTKVNRWKDTERKVVSFQREVVNGCPQMVETTASYEVVKPGWLQTLAPYAQAGATAGAGWLIGDGIARIKPSVVNATASACVPAPTGGNLPLPKP
jgi:hypothetical protein